MNGNEMIKDMEQVLKYEQIRIANSVDGFKQLMKNGVCNCHATALYNANYRKVADDEIVIKKSEYEELKTHIEDLQTKLGPVMLCIKNTHEIDISDLLRKQEQKTAKDILLEVAHALTKGNLNEIELAFIGIRYGIKLKENL